MFLILKKLTEKWCCLDSFSNIQLQLPLTVPHRHPILQGPMPSPPICTPPYVPPPPLRTSTPPPHTHRAPTLTPLSNTRNPPRNPYAPHSTPNSHVQTVPPTRNACTTTHTLSQTYPCPNNFPPPPKHTPKPPPTYSHHLLPSHQKNTRVHPPPTWTHTHLPHKTLSPHKLQQKIKKQNYV